MRTLRRIFLFMMMGLVFLCIVINYHMEHFVNSIPLSMQKRDMAIVLGASVHGDELSEALRGRMEVAITLFREGYVRTILLSGDGTNEYYSETAAMKKFALSNGIPQENLLTDEKGYNTYLTMLRAHEVFNAKSAFVVTQNFHLVRAVWVASQCGINVQGVSAGHIKDPWYYSIREFFARVKDFFQVKLKL